MRDYLPLSYHCLLLFCILSWTFSATFVAIAKEMIIKLNSKTFFKQVYNLGTGHGQSVLEMVKAVEKASGKKVNIFLNVLVSTLTFK